MSQLPPDKPACLITGGTSGVGAASVETFIERGYRIATCGRNQQQLDQLIEKYGHSHVFANVDLANAEAAKKFARQSIAQMGRIDVLVNNAAVAPLCPFAEITADDFEQTLNVNIRSVFYLTQMVWAQMLQQNSGVIVNLSSLAAVDPFPGFNIYGASKSWIDLLTVALAAEGKEFGISTYSIRAGAIETPLLRRLFPDFPSDQCVSANTIAETVYRCAQQQESLSSGQLITVTNQP